MAVVVPNLTAEAPLRFVPLMVTVVVPEMLPVVGVNDVIDGGGA